MPPTASSCSSVRPPAPPRSPPALISVVRLNADGSLDPSFGSGGVASTPVEASGYRAGVALAPDGRVLITGATGQESPAIAHDPFAPGSFKWVVARLTTTGALDSTFGPGGVVTLPGAAADMRGTAVATLADGSVLALADARVGAGTPPTYVTLLTRLTPTGALDPSFAGGAPVGLPSDAHGTVVLALPGGAVLVGASKSLLRFTVAGALDPTFGSGGVAAVGVTLPYPLSLFLDADGSVLALGPSVGSANGITGVRVTPTGSADPTLGAAGATFRPVFGGGESSFVVSVNPRPLPPLTQDSFYVAEVAQRADGSFVAAGSVGVVQPLGEGVGNSIADFAAAAFTPAFTPVTAFGGPAAPLSLRLGVPGQRAATAHTRHGVRVLVNLSAPGLARAYVRAGGRVIAQSVLPVFGSGARILPVELTHAGAVFLRTHRNVHVSVSVSARNLLGATVSATAIGTLK